MSFYQRVISFCPENTSESACAKHLGVGRDVLRMWRLLDEAGRDAEPKKRTLETVAARVGTTPEYLVYGVEPRQPDNIPEISKVEN